MAKYIKGKDGKFAGSIGDGKQRLPLVRPPRGVNLFPAPRSHARPDLTEMYARFQDLQRERQDLARDGLKATILSDYPSATTLIVEEEDTNAALNGYSTPLIPVRITDASGATLWQQQPHAREETDFSNTMEQFAQDLPPGHIELSDDDDGLGRRFEVPIAPDRTSPPADSSEN